MYENCNAPAGQKIWHGTLESTPRCAPSFETERPLGVRLSMEELTAAVTELDSTYRALDARLAPVVRPTPCQNPQDGPRAKVGCDRAPLGGSIAEERERITAITNSIRGLLSALDV